MAARQDECPSIDARTIYADRRKIVEAAHKSPDGSVSWSEIAEKLNKDGRARGPNALRPAARQFGG
jgi:hypothetical protein